MTAFPAGYDQRRDDLTRLLLEVVAKRGLEGATIRAVAAAAGVSIGTVQHYFPTKDVMLRNAYRRIAADAAQHIEASAGTATSPRAGIRAVLLELLPLDQRRDDALRVGIAFGVRALHAPDLAAELYRDTVELRDALAALFASAGAPEPGQAATAAMALTDGLGGQLLFGGPAFTADQAVATLDRHLDQALSWTP